MIDYTIGDKVVCISIEIDNPLYLIEWGVKNFSYPSISQIYTVRDLCPAGDLLWCDVPGVKLIEISAGIDKHNDEWWFEATSFRKLLPSEEADLQGERANALVPQP